MDFHVDNCNAAIDDYCAVHYFDAMNKIYILFLICAVACSPAKPPPPSQTFVSVATPIMRNVVDWDDYVGRFQAIQDVEIKPRITGTVDKILFREGIEVHKGQLLFVIDPRPYQAALAQSRADALRAQATLSNARTELTRAQKLVDAEAISREDYETKLAAVRTASASVISAQANVKSKALDVSFTSIRAPISGRISDKRVAVGDNVSNGTTLLTRIVSTNPIWFSFDGAESFYLKYVRLAQQGTRKSSRYAPNPVDIQLADEKGYSWHGHMSFVDNAIDPQAGTIRAHAIISNPTGFLVPGMFGRARLLGSAPYAALLVPDETIVTDQTRRFVFVVGPDGKTAQRSVIVGPIVEGLRVVKSGLQPSDKIVLDGLARLQPGMAVKVVNARILPRAQDDSPTSVALAAPPASEAKAQ